jgi:hypothetical protein
MCAPAEAHIRVSISHRAMRTLETRRIAMRRVFGGHSFLKLSQKEPDTKKRLSVPRVIKILYIQYVSTFVLALDWRDVSDWLCAQHTVHVNCGFQVEVRGTKIENSPQLAKVQGGRSFSRKKKKAGCSMSEHVQNAQWWGRGRQGRRGQRGWTT